MPANVAIPTVDEFLASYAGGVSAKRDEADTERGSRYEIWGGVGAVLFNRITARARGNFRNNYFDTAEGSALDDLAAFRFPDVSPRVLQTKGVGTITFTRPSSSEGDLFEGTRVRVGQRFYVTTESRHLVDELAVTVAAEAYVAGTGQSVVSDEPVLEDIIFDETLKPTHIEIADGTEEESAAQFRARVRVTKFDNRVGYIPAITRAMQAAGATQVALFASDYFGDALDFGLNRIYVADDSFTASAALLQACRLQVFGSVMCGMGVQVLPLTKQELTVTFTVSLWDNQVGTARDTLEAGMKQRALNYINANPYVWTIDGLSGAARGASQDIADIATTTSHAEPSIPTLFDAPPLIRWSLQPNHLIVIFE